jgi:hypothetical protein
LIRAVIVTPPIPHDLLDLDSVLAIVAAGPKRAAIRGGVTVEERPVQLTREQSIAVPLGSLGELEIGTDGKNLTITAPFMLALMLRQPLEGRIIDESGMMRRTLTVRCASGDSIGLPIGPLGSIAIEVR